MSFFVIKLNRYIFIDVDIDRDGDAHGCTDARKRFVMNSSNSCGIHRFLVVFFYFFFIFFFELMINICDSIFKLILMTIYFLKISELKTPLMMALVNLVIICFIYWFLLILISIIFYRDEIKSWLWISPICSQFFTIFFFHWKKKSMINPCIDVGIRENVKEKNWLPMFFIFKYWREESACGHGKKRSTINCIFMVNRVFLTIF